MYLLWPFGKCKFGDDGGVFNEGKYWLTLSADTSDLLGAIGGGVGSLILSIISLEKLAELNKELEEIGEFTFNFGDGGRSLLPSSLKGTGNWGGTKGACCCCCCICGSSEPNGGAAVGVFAVWYFLKGWPGLVAPNCWKFVSKFGELPWNGEGNWEGWLVNPGWLGGGAKVCDSVIETGEWVLLTGAILVLSVKGKFEFINNGGWLPLGLCLGVTLVPSTKVVEVGLDNLTEERFTSDSNAGTGKFCSIGTTVFC